MFYSCAWDNRIILCILMYTLGLPCGSAGKVRVCNVGDLGSIPRFGRCPGEGKGYPLQHSGLENSMNCIVHGVVKSWTQLSHFHFQCIHYVEGFFIIYFNGFAFLNELRLLPSFLV